MTPFYSHFFLLPFHSQFLSLQNFPPSLSVSKSRRSHMGSCFSVDSNDLTTLPTAKVVSLDGSLREYSVPVAVSDVLHLESPATFLCNSDKLYFDQRIPALNSGDFLQLGHLYLVLPAAKRQFPLSGSDMAALAVKASLALTEGAKKKGGRRSKIRISPVLEMGQEEVYEGFEEVKRYEKVSSSSSSGFSRSGSVRKLKRSASRRTMMTVRSFRLRLSTIYEGTVAE